MMDTIFAPATAAGRAGVGIVRISGPKAHEVGALLCGSLPKARQSAVRLIRDPQDRTVIDQALILSFEANASFTGEPVVEFQHHGSPAVLAKLLKVLGQQNGVRLAEAGEFTRRSLDNGRLDLAQVEGLADLIDAETEAQRRQALRVMEGELSNLVQGWRKSLLRAIALIEATIDFADEDVPVDVFPEVQTLLASVLAEIKTQLSGADAAGQIRSGYEVAIIGRPNVGKSSLINKLSRREVALISDIAGTTRDVIEVKLSIGGHLVNFLDTAGLRETDDLVENLGINLAKRRAEGADLRLFLLEKGQKQIDEGILLHEHDIVIQGKDDDGLVAGVSSHTGHGIDDLIKRIGEIVGTMSSGSSLLIRERHKNAMTAAQDSLLLASEGIENSTPVELVAEDVRSSIIALEMLVGYVGVEDVLGEIFSSFCIGK